MKKFGGFILVPVLFLLVSFTTTTVHAAGQNLKVLSFNIGYTSSGEGLNSAACDDNLDKQIQDSTRRMMQIATYVKNKGIEVVMLQEISKRCGVYEEWVGLDQAFDAIGYPMDIALSNSERPNHGGLHTLTASKYPIDHAAVQTHPVPTKSEDIKRWYIVTPIITDVGRITFYNLHTHNTVACAGLVEFFGRGIVDGNPLHILGGDFNVDITSKKNWQDNFRGCRTGEDGQDLRRKVDAYAIQPNVGIDFVMLPKNQPLSFVSTIKDGASGIRSDHIPVISDVVVNLPVTTPTPTPTPTPLPLQKYCSVALAKTQYFTGEDTTVDLTASTSRTSNEPVGLFIKRFDSSRITPVPTGTTPQDFGDRFYYKYTTPPCQVANNSSCSKSITLPDLGEGKYHVFCDVAQLPSACSGNPNCDINGGPFACSSSGWASCSNNDSAVFTVQSALPQKAGDADRDGDVDIFDFNMILQNFGQTNCSSNLVGECSIDIFDYNKVLENFGS